MDTGASLRLTVLLDLSYQDGHVAAWLGDNSLASKRTAAAAALELPGAIASFHLR